MPMRRPRLGWRCWPEFVNYHPPTHLTMSQDHPRSECRFFHRLRVRWAEVDMQKIVFNAHYLMYFDTAIADYWRAVAVVYEGGEPSGVDDLLDVWMKQVRVGNSSILFVGGLFRGDELLVSCELVYVYADPATQT